MKKTNNNNMKELLKKLTIEKTELFEKMTKLEAFIDNNEKFSEVSGIQQILLVDQFNGMQLYFFALERRINNLQEVK
jgi:predicted nuclease with TOPRIM domain